MVADPLPADPDIRVLVVDDHRVVRAGLAAFLATEDGIEVVGEAADGQAALDELSARTFAIARTLPMVDALRISVGFWTTEDELDKFMDGVRLLAAHTPESIPPRRTLTIIGQA